MELTLVDQGTENKFQIYRNVFTVDDCSKILKQSKYEILPVSKFVDLIMYCLSDDNKRHEVNATVNHKEFIKLDILYKPDQFTSISFTLTVPARKMKEVDLLKLRLRELETSVPNLFYEKLTASKKREKGWNRIKLDYCNDTNNKYIKHNEDTGTIVLLPGKYVIEAEGTAYNVDRHIIQIRSNDDNIKLNGTPQRYYRYNGGGSTSTSRLLKHVIDIQTRIELTFMWWCACQNSEGALAHYPYADLGHTYVAAIVIKRI